jgi:hypothetical protein
LGVLLLAVFVSAMLDPRPSRSGTAAERAHSDDGCDHLSYARARPHTIGSSLFGDNSGASFSAHTLHVQQKAMPVSGFLAGTSAGWHVRPAQTRCGNSSSSWMTRTSVSPP